MPRFFFHYRTDDDFIIDPLGTELPDLEAAQEQAAEVGKVMLAKAVEAGESPQASRCIEIVDEEGVEVLYIVFWASASKPGTVQAEELLKPPTLH
ncbi:DUF6894 family protein [Devosia sp.]|uniref:DUF6894 family protein n=1 Tax=Devosia sp. TaxID=1871048 RepID=UPI003265265E